MGLLFLEYVFVVFVLGRLQVCALGVRFAEVGGPRTERGVVFGFTFSVCVYRVCVVCMLCSRFDVSVLW